MSQTPPTQPPVPGGPPVNQTQTIGTPAAPPPGGPPMPPPGDDPSGTAGGSKKGLLIGLVVVVLLAGAGAGAYSLLFSDDDSDDESAQEEASGDGRTPVDTVRGYVRAYQERDCEALLDHIIEAAWSEDGTVDRADALAACEEGIETSAQQFDELTVAEATLLSEEDDVAVVELVSSVADAPEATEEVELLREGGAWRVDPGSFQPGGDTGTDEGSGEETSGEETTDTTEADDPDAGSTEADSPEDVMWAADEALQTGDCDTLLGLLSEQALQDWGTDESEQQATCQDFVDQAPPPLEDVELVDESGTTATVEVTYAGAEPGQVNLVLEDDEWKLDLT